MKIWLNLFRVISHTVRIRRWYSLAFWKGAPRTRGRNNMEEKPPSPTKINEEVARREKTRYFVILDLGEGWSKCSTVQDSNLGRNKMEQYPPPPPTPPTPKNQ